MVSGTSCEEILARAEAYLHSGNLAGAVKEVSVLEGGGRSDQRRFFGKGNGGGKANGGGTTLPSTSTAWRLFVGDLIDVHKARVIKSGVMSYSPQYIRRMVHTLHKWKLLSMTREHALDAILFADVDVEVCPTEVCHSLAGRRLVSDEWNTRVAALVAASRTNGSEFVVLGAGDVTTRIGVPTTSAELRPRKDATRRRRVRSIGDRSEVEGLWSSEETGRC